jgi:hypothetical protein
MFSKNQKPLYSTTQKIRWKKEGSVFSCRKKKIRMDEGWIVFDPPAEGGGIEHVPVDVMSIIIVYTLGGHMNFNQLYSRANKTKNETLRRMRIVSRHFWRSVTRYVLRNTDHTVVYTELSMLYCGRVDEDLVSLFGNMALLKMCENEAGKMDAKQSLLATFYLYVTGQCAQYSSLSGRYNKWQRDRIQKHFKQLCLNKRGKFRVAFKAISDVIQWVQDSQEVRKLARNVSETNALLSRHQETVDRLNAKRLRYETDRVEAEKREAESKQRLDERVKRLKDR